MEIQTVLLEKMKHNCEELLQSLKEYESNAEMFCLKEIQAVIKDSRIDDFDAVEEIVSILNKYGWSTGSRHDFG